MRRTSKLIYDPVRKIYQVAQSEEDVLGSIRSLLEANGAKVFRSIERVPKCYRCGQWLGSSERGLPDLSVLFPKGSQCLKDSIFWPFASIMGVWSFIEVKRKKGRLRASQEAWLDSARESGAICFKADSLEEMVREFGKYGITIRGLK